MGQRASCVEGTNCLAISALAYITLCPDLAYVTEIPIRNPRGESPPKDNDPHRAVFARITDAAREVCLVTSSLSGTKMRMVSKVWLHRTYSQVLL